MSRHNFSSDNYREDDTDERERDAESRSDADREERGSLYDWKNIDPYSSHRPMLYWAMQKVLYGTVIELGAGSGSTPLLEKMCEEQGRNFVSYETSREYVFSPDKTKFIESYDNVEFESCGILFIDNAPGERRAEDVKRFADKAQVIIVHDTEPGAEYVYKLAEVLKSFKYSCTLKNSLGLPETTAVSNTFDVTQWRKVRTGEFWFE